MSTLLFWLTATAAEATAAATTAATLESFVAYAWWLPTACMRSLQGRCSCEDDRNGKTDRDRTYNAGVYREKDK